LILLFLFPFLPQQVITKIIPFGKSKEKEELMSGVAKRDLSSKSVTMTEKDFASLGLKVKSKRMALSHDKMVKGSSKIVLDANFEWLNHYFKAIQDGKRTILSKSNVKILFLLRNGFRPLPTT
jgi:hypothetical protein